MLAATSVAHASEPLIFRCQATPGNVVEEQLCEALLGGLNEYDKFYKPDPSTGDMTLYVDVSPLQGDDEFTVAAGFSIEVLLRRNDMVLDFSFVTGAILTDSDKISAESWTDFWRLIDDTSDGFFEKATSSVKQFCITRRSKVKETYAWTKTSTCASTMNVRLTSGVSGILPIR